MVEEETGTTEEGNNTMTMKLEECVIKEIVVEPLLGSNFEESVRWSLIHAIQHDVNVTVIREGKPFRIVPREIVRRIFEQQREEGGE